VSAVFGLVLGLIVVAIVMGATRVLSRKQPVSAAH